MKTNIRIFSLDTSTDLLKLKHDYERIKMDPTDQYAAFDFLLQQNTLLIGYYQELRINKIEKI